MQRGRPPRQSDWASGAPGRPTYKVAYRLFGSWRAALLAAGLPVPPARSNAPDEGWDEQRVIDAIREWTEQFGGPPTLLDWNPGLARHLGFGPAADRFEDERPRYPRSSLAVRLFGSWRLALAAAEQSSTVSGLRRTAPRPRLSQPGTHFEAWTREEVLAALQSANQQRGTPPRYEDWVTVDRTGRRPTTPVVLDRFGSWNQAPAAAPRGRREAEHGMQLDAR